MNKLLLWIVIALSCISVGCASSPITPNAIPLGQHDLTFVNSRKPVAVVNMQQPKLVEMQCKYTDGGTDVRKIDLDSLCEQSISLINQWLRHNSIPIDKTADRKLFVSVLNPVSERAGSYTLDLKIETVNGLVKTFKTEATGGSAGRSFGYAINWAVVKIIHDADILCYMEQ